MRPTTFMITGGAGRVITAIPALEKYARLNPQDDFKVIVHGWEDLYWNHPILQPRTYGVGQKGIFDLIIKNSTLKCPEPYHLWNYYNQKKSLAEAFDEEINQTDDHNDLSKPNLYLHSNEIKTAQAMIQEALSVRKRDSFVVFQPYGSGMTMINNMPSDPTNRSLNPDDALELAQMLSQKAVVLYFGDKQFIHPRDNFMLNAQHMNVDLRFYMAMIANCDAFVGVDSVGQHMARAFDKPGTVIMGSTFDVNVSYPEHFKIVRNGKVVPVYSPIRIGGMDADFAERINDGAMRFSPEQLRQIAYDL